MIILESYDYMMNEFATTTYVHTYIIICIRTDPWTHGSGSHQFCGSADVRVHESTNLRGKIVLNAKPTISEAINFETSLAKDVGTCIITYGWMCVNAYICMTWL